MALGLFLIVDPVAAVPFLLAITQDNTKEERRQMVRRAVLVAAVVLLFFALAGQAILGYLGVGLAAVKVAGGILIFVIGMEVLFGRLSRTRHSEAETEEAEEKEDISITPLAIPLLAGPGAIAVVLASVGSNYDLGLIATVLVAIAAVMLLSWVILTFSEILYKVLGTIGVKVIARVFGLLLLFMAAQLVLNGLQLAGAL